MADGIRESTAYAAPRSAGIHLAVDHLFRHTLVNLPEQADRCCFWAPDSLFSASFSSEPPYLV